MTEAIFHDFHLFSGSGGGALGFSWAGRRLGPLQGRFECIGGIDVSPNRCLDFEMLLARPAAALDLFTAEDWVAHASKYDRKGRLVREATLASDWREVTAADVRAAAGGRRPHVIFLSAPCKGFSGLLSNALSDSDKYQALNRLTVRGLRLALEAWSSDPPEFVVFENVPRIAQRGADLLDEIVRLLQRFGYAVHRDAHCCGELGGLGQRRRRFLLLARHVRKVRPFLYRPPIQRVRSIGEIIGPLPMPEDPAGGRMHLLPRLKPKTLLRLALIPAGRDWRALADVDPQRIRVVPAPGQAGPRFNNVFRVVSWAEASPAVTAGAGPSSGGLAVEDPRMDLASGFANVCRISDWDQPAPTVTAAGRPSGGAVSVGDPRPPRGRGQGKYKPTRFDEPAGTVIAASSTGQGAFAFADPRVAPSFGEHGTKLQVDRMDGPARTVTGARVGSGAPIVADARLPGGTDWRGAVLGVRPWDEPSVAVPGRSGPTNGALAVEDVRLGCAPNGAVLRVAPDGEPAPTVVGQQNPWSSGGFTYEDVRLRRPARNSTLGVQAWDAPGATVTASLDVQAGAGAVEDVRGWVSDYLVILSEDGTWHRPLTTWELAALQSFPLVVNGQPLVLHGTPTEWREAVGNAVPPLSAKAIAEVLLDALLEEVAGVTFKLSSNDVWVSPDDLVGRGLGWVG